MVRNWVLTAVALLSLLGAGCITAETNDEPEDEPVEPELKNETLTLTGPVSGPKFHVEDTVVGGGWSFMAPATIQSLSATLGWTQAQNAFQLRVTHDNGTETVQGADGKATYAPESPVVGLHAFDVVGRGAVLEDTLTLTVTYSWLQHPGDSPLGLVSYTQENGRWRATITFTREAEADALTLDLKTFNGGITVEKVAESTATGTVEAWAVADSKERAGELVQQIPVSLIVGDGKMTAHASGQNVDRARNENIGARITAEVPGSVSGSASTSNGKLTFTDIETSGLTASTSNGGIDGELTSSGDIELDTSNGEIGITLTPTKSLELDLSTSNGAIDLTLKESSSIGYKLDASTSNGKISEDMSEASLSGESDTKKTLKTDGYDTRSIKVSGTASTSNGSIDFTSA